MQALRKSSSLAATVAPRAEPVGPQAVRDHAATASPALALRDRLAARLEEMAQGTGNGVALVAEPTVAKLPMQARVLVIVGLSLALWSGLIAAVATFAF